MAKNNDVHTVPKKSGKGWVNKVNGKVVSRHNKKSTAKKKGRQVAKDNKSEHRIHNMDGKIGECNSYGNDPNPPKDKNR